MSQFEIVRDSKDRWNEATRERGVATVMHWHVSALEELLKEKCERTNSIIGGLRENEYIDRLLIKDDGTIEITTKFYDEDEEVEDTRVAITADNQGQRVLGQYNDGLVLEGELLKEGVLTT